MGHSIAFFKGLLQCTIRQAIKFLHEIFHYLHMVGLTTSRRPFQERSKDVRGALYSMEVFSCVGSQGILEQMIKDGDNGA